MGGVVRRSVAVCLHSQHLKRTCSISLLVGTWLTLFNQGDVLLAMDLTPALAGKIVLNYLTPFVVSNWGLISRKDDVDT